MIAAVAAGHPATAAAGVEILAAGGSAADAAIAACLASCVAESVMTGLLGGGHAIVHDAASGRTRNLDCFCAAPSGAGEPMQELPVRFGEELVHYAIGAASFAVPGVPAGLDALWREHGSLPWARLVEPALQLAREGVAMPAAHAFVLAMLEPVMTLREGGRIHAPNGALLREGDRLRQPGLVRTLELLRADGSAQPVYAGPIAAAILDLMSDRGGAVTAGDLAAYEAHWSEPLEAGLAGRRILTRGGLAGVAATLARLEPGGGEDALLAALDSAPAPGGHTTNICSVDPAGNACVLTTSLGLGSGDWLPGLDLHLNSMLGERDLVLGGVAPGERLESMLAPTLAFDDEGLELAIGAAGGTRIRTALVGVLATVLAEGGDLPAAIERPRFHPSGDVVNAEPGVDERFLARLEGAGTAVRRWPARHHYFGGVSAIGRRAAAADGRRSGAARLVDP